MAAQLWLEDENSSQSHKDEDQDLFVFGYACKIFRNDEKALYVDRGRHLIPWMGDESLMIDRYDGRGHLYDLSQCDADNVEKTELNPEELNLEKLCDEERYLELNTDIAEKTVYEEEEWKRYQEALQSGYNAVGFSYEQPASGQDIYHQDAIQTEEEKPFVPSMVLNKLLPPNLELPTTNKINAVIEKTAKFIAEHGPQMEIVLKAKQALNSQFDFLDYNNCLNSYYKFMVKVVKSGKYVPKSESAEVERQESQEDGEHPDHSEHGYLHKSLAIKVQPTKSVKMPVVAINDTPYGQLVKSIKKHHQDDNESELRINLPSLQYATHHYPHHQSHQYQHHDQDFNNQQQHQMHTLPAPTVKSVTQETMHRDDNNSNEQVLNQSTEVQAPIVQNIDNVPPDSHDISSPIIPPPPDIQPIIDRMAMYVAKNGSEFEMVVKSKNDARFQFLNDWHVHYRYYDFKKKMHQKQLLKEKKEKEETQAAMLNKGVSFSIKTRSKENDSVAPLKKPLFDYGSSDDNDSESEKEKSASSTPSSDHTTKPAIQTNITTDILTDEKKVVEDKLMNKLAGAAREKLAQTSKEKQIQAERKRKAAMFISLLKGKNEPENKKTDHGCQDKSSPNNRSSGPITPPLSYSQSRRTSSRSPNRKPYSHKRDSRSRSPFGFSRKSTPTSPRRRSRTPRISPVRRRSPKNPNRSPYHSPKQSHSRSSSDRKSSRSHQIQDVTQRSLSKEKDPKCQPDLIELTHLTKIVIKKEKVDPEFERIAKTASTAIMSNNCLISEIIENNDTMSEKQYCGGDDDNDDDVQIVEVPEESVEPEELVDLTNISDESDSDINSHKKSRKHERRRRSRSRSYSRKKGRRSVSRKRQRRSPSPRRRRSRSPKRRRSCSLSYSRSSKHSRKHRSRSKSPKRKRERTPRHRKSKSKSPVRKADYHHRSSNKSHKKNKSRSRSPKRKKARSKSPSASKRLSRSRSKSPVKKRSRTPKNKKKKHKSPSRSPKPQKKKKSKDILKQSIDNNTLTDGISKSTEELNLQKDRLSSQLLENEHSQKSNDDSLDAADSESSNTVPPANLLNKVRAMLKASRDVLTPEEQPR